MLSKRVAVLWFVAAVTAGVSACVSFELGWTPPIAVSVAAFAAVLVVMWAGGPACGDLYLSRYIAFVYALPFVGCVEYVFASRDFLNQPFIWGLTANDYQRDLGIVTRMTLVGAIGALGLAAGFILAVILTKRSKTPISTAPLQWPVFAVAALLAFVLSWLDAPVDLITTVAYTESKSLLAGTNFNAAYLLSYTLVGAAAVDAVIEKRLRVRAIKKILLAVLVVVIVGWFQFARGDRESVGLIGALAVLMLDMYRKRKHWIRRAGGIVLVAVLLASIFVVSQVVGVVRSETSWQPLESAVRRSSVDYLHGTWSAVLMTPLSVVGDVDRGLMPPRWGKTYVDYFLSIPPGPIAAAIGYKRPLEGDQGPAWEMRYGLGGTHIVVVPFMNFRSYGVLFVLMAYGFLVGWSQIRAYAGGFAARLWYLSLAIVAPFWLWYGEMSLVREWMAFVVVVAVVLALKALIRLARGLVQTQVDAPATA